MWAILVGIVEAVVVVIAVVIATVGLYLATVFEDGRIAFAVLVIVVLLATTVALM